MRKILLGIFLLVLVGCDSSINPVRYSGTGTVRSVIYSGFDRDLIFETNDHHVNVFNVCYSDPSPPLWTGMKGYFFSQWQNYSSWNSTAGCYHISNVVRIP